MNNPITAKLTQMALTELHKGTEIEIKCIRNLVLDELKKNCSYCHIAGHLHTMCATYKRIKERCKGDKHREAVRGRISNNLRIKSRAPLSNLLAKRDGTGRTMAAPKKRHKAGEAFI